MDQVLQRLFEILDPLGIKVRVLLLDRGFYSVKVIRALIERQQPFIMPAIKRGKAPTQRGGPTGTYVMAEWNCSAWTSYTMSSTKDGQVDFDLAVVCHNLKGRWGKHKREAWLYAAWGLKRRPLVWIREVYRTRFGIEASYRQVHQAKIKTSSRNPISRLLFVGVALILRNVWVWLHAEVASRINLRCSTQARWAPPSGRLAATQPHVVVDRGRGGSALSTLTRYRCLPRPLQGRTRIWDRFQLLIIRKTSNLREMTLF